MNHPNVLSEAFLTKAEITMGLEPSKASKVGGHCVENYNILCIIVTKVPTATWPQNVRWC